MSDEELVMLVQATKDAASFGELVRRHQAALRAFLRKMTNDLDRADDLAQEAFIRAFNKIGLFRGASTFRTWLFQIAYREFLQERRKSGSIGRLLDGFKRQTEIDGASVANIPEPASRIDLQRGLNGLEPLERAALLLCDAYGMTNEEAAAAMDTPLGSVKTYIRRGRDKMRAALTSASEDATDQRSATGA